MSYRNIILAATPVAAMGIAYSFYPSGITRERLMFAGIVGLGSFLALAVVSKLTTTPTLPSSSGNNSQNPQGTR